MSAILPPAERLWWKHPLDRVEGTWIAIAFVWCMVMFFMMIYWHAYGKQNLSTETYKTTPEQFSAKARYLSFSAGGGSPRRRRGDRIDGKRDLGRAVPEGLNSRCLGIDTSPRLA